MQRPILSRMCETFIKIDIEPTAFHQSVFQTIKTKLYPTIEQLKKDGKVDWYSFLIHSRQSGVPTTVDDNNAYFHIRFSLSKDVIEKDVLETLPDFCVMTRKAPLSGVESISMGKTKYNTSLRKHEGIEEVWRIIGEQSELMLKVFDSYKDDAVIPLEEIGSLLHYFHNMVQFSMYQCSKCGSAIQL
jgi:hypothetical protein